MEQTAAIRRQGWKKKGESAARGGISNGKASRGTFSGGSLPSGNLPLAMASPGVKLTVGSIRGRDETRRFLESLGFSEGASVTVVTELEGNLIVNIRGARVALGKAMAARITVSQESAD